jgi:hypothetical protein
MRSEGKEFLRHDLTYCVVNAVVLGQTGFVQVSDGVIELL